MLSRGGPVRLALLGCGEVTRAKHLPALSRLPNVQVVALCDSDLDLCNAVGDQFHVSTRTSDAATLFSVDEIDAFGICTNPAAHAPLAIAAMRAGKAVYVEKPLALTPEACAELVDESKRAGVVAMTGFHMRFHRLVAEARRLLLEGAVGPVHSIRVVWHSPRGDRNIPEWKKSREHGGGALVEIAVHHLDLIRFLLNDNFETVRALSTDGVRHDETSVLVASTTNGVLVTGEFSERSPHEIEIVVSGLHGILRLDCLKFDGLDIRPATEVPGAPSWRLRSVANFAQSLPAGIRSLQRGGEYRISYENAWRHFLECVRSGATPSATFEDGLHATEAVVAAVKSCATGELVTVGRPR